MIYIIPPTPRQGVDQVAYLEPSWRFRAEYPNDTPRKSSSFNISETVAKVLADKGVPVVHLGSEPTGATEAALVEALEEIDRLNLRINKRVLREIGFAIDLLGEGSRLLLPQVYWDCQRAWKAVEDAQNRYETAHADLMRYAATQLGLPEDVELIEGPHQ